MSSFRRRRAQASFEFILVLTITLLIATAFILSISEEYSDMFILSAVKNTAQEQIAATALASPNCWNSSLVAMNYSTEDKKVTLTIAGCPLDLPAIAAKVETKICGAKTPTGGPYVVCGGEIYTLEEA